MNQTPLVKLPARKRNFSVFERYHPSYPWFLARVLVLFLAFDLIGLVAFGLDSLGSVPRMVIELALVRTVFASRDAAANFQDRLIRLEDLPRLASRLPPDLAERVVELGTRQLDALRLVSDAELPALVRTVLDEGLTAKEIGRRIQASRP